MANRVPKNTREIPTTTPGKAYPIKLIGSINRFIILGYRINFTEVTKASKAIIVVAITETITELSTVFRDNIIDSPCSNPLNNQNLYRSSSSTPLARPHAVRKYGWYHC